MRCAVAGAWASWQGVIELDLPEGATVGEALEAARARLRGQSPAAAGEAEWDTGAVGVFGEVCGRDRRLREGDRVEVYRPLSVDPKAARRARAQSAAQQGSRGRAPARSSQG